MDDEMITSMETRSLMPSELKSQARIKGWLTAQSLLTGVGFMIFLRSIGVSFVYSGFNFLYTLWCLFISFYLISPSKLNRGLPKYASYMLLYKSKKKVYIPVGRSFNEKEIL